MEAREPPFLVQCHPGDSACYMILANVGMTKGPCFTESPCHRKATVAECGGTGGHGKGGPEEGGPPLAVLETVAVKDLPVHAEM